MYFFDAYIYNLLQNTEQKELSNFKFYRSPTHSS